MKNFIKKNWFRLFIILILIIVSFSLLAYIFDKKRNSNFYKNQDCQKENSISYYNSKTNKCEIKKIKLPDFDFCDFEIFDIKINQFHFDGPDYERISRLEESCKTGGTFSSLSCGWAEDEKKSNREDTYIEIEGLLKSQKDERLHSIISKIYTKGENKILLGVGSDNFKRDVGKDESIPFKISVYINRKKELIGNFFSKDDEVDIDTYPWFLTCE